jgi:hypothetical protein
MKKKFKEGIDILIKISAHKKIEKLNILDLIYKYLGYGYFKES